MTFDPPSGSYTNATTVRMQSSTANATILYTVDGSDPTISVQSVRLYTAPIQLAAGTLALRAYAISPGRTASGISAAAYSVPDHEVCGRAGVSGVVCAGNCSDWYYDCAAGRSAELMRTPAGTVCVQGELMASDHPVCSSVVSQWCVGREDGSYCEEACGRSLVRCDGGRLASNVTLHTPLVCHSTSTDGRNASVVNKKDQCAAGVFETRISLHTPHPIPTYPHTP